jgi:hypothetical protein
LQLEVTPTSPSTLRVPSPNRTEPSRGSRTPKRPSMTTCTPPVRVTLAAFHPQSPIQQFQRRPSRPIVVVDPSNRGGTPTSLQRGPPSARQAHFRSADSHATLACLSPWPTTSLSQRRQRSPQGSDSMPRGLLTCDGMAGIRLCATNAVQSDCPEFKCLGVFRCLKSTAYHIEA